MNPGLVYDMPDETYHADPVEGGSLSSTFARLLTRHVPAKAHERLQNRKTTQAMNLGKAAHAHALDAGPQLIVWQHDGRTKAGKAERDDVAALLATEAAVAVTEEERDRILGMAKVLRAELTVRKILDTSRPEVSAFAQDGRTWLRARFDLLGPVAYDYKTTEDCSRRGFSKAMGRYGYHQQAEFYQRILAHLEHPAAEYPLRFICQETEPPYLIQVHTPDAEALELAKALNDRAIGIYAEAKSTGIWPGYPTLVAEPVGLPSFYFYDLDDVLPDEWRALGELELKL